MIRNVQTDETSLSNRYPFAQEGVDESDREDELEKEFSNLLRRAGASLNQADVMSAIIMAASQVAQVRVDKPAPIPQPVDERKTSAEHTTVSVKDAPVSAKPTADNTAQSETSSNAESNQNSHQEVGTRKVAAETAVPQHDVVMGESVSSAESDPEAATADTPALLPQATESASTHGVTRVSESTTRAVDSGSASNTVAVSQGDSEAFPVENIPVATSAQDTIEGGVKEVKTAETAAITPQASQPSTEIPIDPNPLAATSAVAEASVRFAMLQKAVGEAVMKGEGRTASQLQASQGSSPSTAIGAASASRDTSNDMSRAAKSLPKSVMIRTFERVENVLKEVAKSRDGKTLSFKLDPVDLGQVKVDVSLRDGGLHARITPESQQVTSLLRERAHELQSSLRRLGLNVDSVTVTVNSDQATLDQSGGQGLNVSTGNGGMMFDGNSFQGERNNMPGQSTQVTENSFGNELADISGASKTVGNSLASSGWVA